MIRIGHHTQHNGANAIGSMDPGKGPVTTCSVCGKAPKLPLNVYRKTGVSNLLTNRKLREIIALAFAEIDRLEHQLEDKR
jgi:hypothetical protein